MRLRRLWQRAAANARRVLGVPDYDAYVAHLRLYHPERAIPTRSAFFAEREAVRYRGGGGRCC
ncbi:MAG TPA: YbdD/YjiX family protein [Rhodanobacteraceae bacterium]|nr:YbdD/YjiX family protein [Rhodanobacteraceae bacterium]